jgi:hypothetical protein
MKIDVFATVRIRVNAPDQNKAENIALNLLENHLADCMKCPAVIATGITLSPENPVSVLAKRGKEF